MSDLSDGTLGLMAAVTINPDRVREFSNAGSLYRWLSKHHDQQDELWMAA